MYEAFYGLTSKPFQLNPDPTFYFGSKQHSRAKAYLEYGVSRHEGFVVITGEVGAGKTTILRALINGLAGTQMVVGHLVTTSLGGEDTLRMVGAAFGVRVKDVPKAELLLSLETFLIDQTRQGRRCLLIVDEAQNLSAAAVEELRMLSNFQYGTHSLLQTFLVGQPEFRDILQRPEMEQFRQRVTATCHIGPLDVDETKGYIEHRLHCAGAKDKPSFEATVFEAVHRATRGIPRRINTVCDRLLLLGFLSERSLITANDVAVVVKELAEETSGGSVRRAVAMPSVASGGVASLGAIDPSCIDLSPEDAEGLSTQLASLVAEQRLDQLQRLERSILRLERIQVQTLGMLTKLVEAVHTPLDEKNK
jgi:general secretion pathway protein A